ncbi:MAG: phosphotransferase [Isosphaeraceae bacterium]
MGGKFKGYVSRHDPMYDFLWRVMSDQFGIRESRPAFRVFGLTGSNEVYGYEEKCSGARLICKFYGARFGWDRDKAADLAHREYRSLETLRGYGLSGSPHHVIRPLALERDLNCVLALEYYHGEQFSQAIARAIHQGDHGHLFWRLKSLAYYLATQHNRTANGLGVNFDSDSSYFGKVIRSLRKRHRIGEWDADELLWLSDCWRERPRMWQDQEVWLHGDATPANFLFGREMDAAAIDLERMKRGDRVFDIGRVAGEIQHSFMSATGDKDRAEPFIGHFLWEYSCHCPDRDDAFRSITARTPYYMGLNLLRIARNHYIDHEYAGRLVGQAKNLLRAA